jgi:hypothetical protein
LRATGIHTVTKAARYGERMDSASRCARPGCGQPAAALLGYDYAIATVRLDPIDADPGGTVLGLCAAHAETLRVPLGWTVEDHRRPVRLLPSIAV